MILLTLFILILAAHYFLFLNSIKNGLDKLNPVRNNSIIQKTITIIIVFRNEGHNILNLINSLNKLEYDQYKLEIIFVDDHSTDQSVSIIKENIELKKYKIIELNRVENSTSYKKHAITQAINSSSGEIILMTDADCIVPPKWIKSTLSVFNDETAIVSGPVTFIEETTFFEKFQKLEFAGLNLVGAGLIGIKRPKIASAANFAIRKKVFFEINGYKGIDGLASGDDELLMQKVDKNTDYRIIYNKSVDAVVKTKGNSTFNEFSQQRIRWASKGLFYNDRKFILQLILIALFYISLPLLLLLGIIDSILYFLVFIFAFIIKMLPEYLVLRYGKKFLFDKSLLKLFLPAQFIQIPYIIFASIMGNFGNYYWKGRKIKR
jgi:cellulose synthase/poly-beta-1,6-N-acetylglucosamine synthase-like glycosyltransferase